MTDYNAKITEMEVKTPNICDLATNAALTTIENKIPNIHNLGKKKKTNYNTNIVEIEKKKIAIIIKINIFQLQSLIL